MSYKDTYNKFNITQELLVNRYMLSVLMINTFNLIELLQAKERSTLALLDSKTKNKLKKQVELKPEIEFNNFKVTVQQYEALVREYGPEVVSNACVILDKYIQTSNKPVLKPYQKLKDWAINLAMKEKLSDYTSTITQAVKNVDYKLIQDKATAVQYIQGIPIYLRNIDEGCNYLKERFNI